MSADVLSVFDLEALDEALAGTTFQGRVTHLRSVGSTNQVALEAAQAGARAGVWIADEQTAGRGRGGHTWHSAAGEGLYLSVLTVPRVPLALAFKIPLAVGLAAQAAVLAVIGLVCDLRWPNDLMFGEKKFGGILVESVSEPFTDASASHAEAHGPRLRYAVIGIGINVNHAVFPAELHALATSLAIEGHRILAREALVAALLEHLQVELEGLKKDGDGHRGIVRRFTAASSWVWGKRVRVEEGGGYTGCTAGLNADGFLLVNSDDGVCRTVYSGGVRSA